MTLAPKPSVTPHTNLRTSRGQGGKQEVDYRVEGGWGALTVDAKGGVTLQDALDREGPGGTIGVAKILGVDRGQPPLTATATLTITLTDINDTPPFLLPPTVFHVTEGDAPTRLGTLTATDQDVWALGHGPPFTLSLAPSNPAHVHAHITLKFDPRECLLLRLLVVVFFCVCVKDG